MTLRVRGVLFGTLLATSLAWVGCDESDGGSTSTDTGVRDDTGGSTDQGLADTGAGEDTGDSGMGSDQASDGEGTCADFSGLFVASGSCEAPLDFPTALCAHQTACDVFVYTPVVRTTFEGETTATSASIFSGAPFQQTCDVSLDGGITFECEAAVGAGTAECSGSLTPVASDFELCCDLIEQNCPEGERCQIYEVGGVLTSACLPETGTVGEGESCLRDDDRPFHDDCEAGQYCTGFGTPDGERTCRAYCTDSSQCAEGEACHLGSGTPGAGRCLPQCSPFAEADDGGCPEGTGCYTFGAYGGSTMTMCLAHVDAPVAEGNPCTNANDCEAGAFCYFSRCTAACDADNGCDEGESCVAYGSRFAVEPGFPASLGICE